MAPNPRKRGAAIPCNMSTISKSHRIGDPDAMPPMYDGSDRLPQHNGMLTKFSTLPVPSLTICMPAVLHQQHPDSRIGQNFHWVPYPIGLMPFDSWHKLHHREDFQPPLPFRCPVCLQERTATAHMRKVFLVAERLSWDPKTVPIHDKDLNEELNWKVNYELGILEPFVEDPALVPGGKNSRSNKFHPYQNEHEMKLALRLIFMTEDIKEVTWSLWINTQLNLQNMLEDHHMNSLPNTSGSASTLRRNEKIPSSTSAQGQTLEPTELIDLTGSPEPALRPAYRESYGLSAQPLSLPRVVQDAANQNVHSTSSERHESIPEHNLSSEITTRPSTTLPSPKRIQSYKSLQDFYSLLDNIERTSYVGALFLEAYAEKLRDDMCKSCWLKYNIRPDLY